MSYISTIIKNDDVVVWERDETGDRVQQFYRAPYYFYVDDTKGKYTTIYNTRVSKLTFENSRQYVAARKDLESDNIPMWESDIGPEIRILSQHYYGVPAPKLHVTFLDIEVDFKVQVYPKHHMVRVRKRSDS